MKNMWFNVLRLLFYVIIFTPLTLQAQTFDEGDSVMLTGIVFNHHTNKPYSYCPMRFVRSDSTVYDLTTEADGTFATPMMPVGRYALHVRLKGVMYHHADLDLQDNAHLNVAIDTIKLITLKAITIVAAKHMLGQLQITSRHDLRLWGLSAGYRDGNSSVALPPDAHGKPDDGPEADDGQGLPRGPVFPTGMPLKVQVAYMTGRLGSSFYTGPIWTLVPDVYHPAPDSTAVKASR